MKVNNSKRLNLKKRTIVNLNAFEQSRIKGGSAYVTITLPPCTCPCETLTCKCPDPNPKGV